MTVLLDLFLIAWFFRTITFLIAKGYSVDFSRCGNLCNSSYAIILILPSKHFEIAWMVSAKFLE